MENILKRIESHYPVEEILVNGEQVWPYLRVAYFYEYFKKVASEKGESYAGVSFSQKLKMLRYIFYGLDKWFGKYDYIALSNTLERRNINGKYFNKLIDPIIDEVGQERFLYLEIPAPSLYPPKQVHTKNVVCRHLLTLFALLLQVCPKRSYVIEGKSILETIQKEYGLKINDLNRIRFYESQRRIFNLLFRRIRPKAIFSTDYTADLPAIRAAKDFGIKVIEVQHGMMGQEHPAYSLKANIDKSCFPDYFLVFGKRELETFDNSQFIERENVYPVGSFYIEYIRQNHKPKPNLAKQLENYRKIIGISLEWTTENRVLEFVSQAAVLDGTILYLLIPRKPKEERYATLNLPGNVRVVRDENFYELMCYVDFHSTVYSTCALEAPSLGVQNILINIDGLSKRFYGNVLNDSRVTRYVNTPAEFVSTINAFGKLDRDTISALNEDIIARDYKKNIRDFLRKLV